MRGASALMAAALICLQAASAWADDAPVKIKTYAISGSTGAELYESIGENGPRDGNDRGSIAQTVMHLKWNRLFDERGGDCYLVHARPSLTITMILPKPDKKLSASMQASWQRFITGVRTHEDVHVQMIRELVSNTQQSVAGAMVKNDRSCGKVKAEVSRRINEATAAHKARSRAYDRDDFGSNGKLGRLVISFYESR